MLSCWVLAARALGRFVKEPPQDDNFPDWPATVVRALKDRHPLPNAPGQLPEGEATVATVRMESLAEKAAAAAPFSHEDAKKVWQGPTYVNCECNT